MRVRVPVSTKDVIQVLSENTQKFEDSLNTVKRVVSNALRGLNVNKIYSRGDSQFGNEIKDGRKIALKFNKHHEGSPGTEQSLLNVPDIIGFTIVVAFQSEIQNVVDRIEQILEVGLLQAGSAIASANEINEDDPERQVFDVYAPNGRVLKYDGYFACHYNLQIKSVETDLPICEIQIKTVLQDAWGAKTHDLTYKNSSAVDPLLKQSFSVMGETLLQIDKQSDLMRESMQKRAKARADKQKAVNTLVLKDMKEEALEKAQELALDNFSDLFTSISEMTPLTDASEIDTILSILIDIFSSHPDGRKAVLTALKFLAIGTSSPRAQQEFDRALKSWIENENNSFERAKAMATIALLHYYHGEKMQAVEDTIAAFTLLENIPPEEYATYEQLYLRRCNSLSITIAYYNAEILGTHEGTQANALDDAQKYLDISLTYREQMEDCPNDCFISIEELDAALKHPSRSNSNFDSLDCEVFVRIQLATTAEDVSTLQQWMHNELYGRFPGLGGPGNESMECLRRFHDYCARQRLNELE